MQLHVCIGFLESRDGPLLGLRDFVERQVRPRYPGLAVSYNSWRDPLAESIAASHKPGVPLILLGHSYGSSALFRAVRRLPGVAVDHFILLDPVPRWGWGQFQWSCYTLPPNVKAATCIYNPISLPKSSPIRNVGREGAYRNVTVRPFHASIPGDAEVQGMMLEIITRTLGSRAGGGAGGKVREVRVPPVVRVGL